MIFDPNKYPRTNDYIQTLPDGFSSYPDCQVKSDSHADLATVLKPLEQDSNLPGPILAFVAGDYQYKWMPEVMGNTLLLLARDTVFSSDEELFFWARENMERLLTKPLYRMFMRVFSTTLVIMGATKRWSAFHVGTDLTAEPVVQDGKKFSTTMLLSYPPHMYNYFLLQQLTQVYLITLKVSHAVDPQIKIHDVSERQASFKFSWLSE